LTPTSASSKIGFPVSKSSITNSKKKVRGVLKGFPTAIVPVVTLASTSTIVTFFQAIPLLFCTFAYKSLVSVNGSVVA
jgi:hypothetical protein